MKRRIFPLRVITDFLIEKKFEHACENVFEIQFYKGSLWAPISTRENVIHRDEIMFVFKRLKIDLEEFIEYCSKNKISITNDNGPN